MKKICLTLLAIVIGFAFVYAQPVQTANAAIFSKVATVTAKKAVKEVIKESAFDIAINLFLDEAYRMAADDLAKYQAQQDYELFCGKKMPDLITCEKPMQAKKVLTVADKTNIGNQAEIELDKLITNGKGFTRWQKFLDWFLPIWVASFALTAITYAIDPEVKSLFNEAGYNALVALGIIKPVYENVTADIPTEDANPSTPTEPTGTKQDVYTTNVSPANSGSNNNYLDVTGQLSQKGLFELVLEPSASYVDIFRFYFKDTYSTNVYIRSTNLIMPAEILNVTPSNPATLTIALNSEVILTEPFPNTGSNSSLVYSDSRITTEWAKIQSVLYRMPYEINGFLYTDVLFNTSDGNVLKYQIKSISTGHPTTFGVVRVQMTPKVAPSAANRLTYYPNYFGKKEILVPTYEEVETQLDMVGQSDYSDDAGQVALVPPSAFPYTQTSTGIELTPETDPNTGEKKFTTPSGESVPEDDITVGEPNIQDNPTPTPNTVTPPATQTNPVPEPIPLTPAPPTPPVTGTPPPPEDGGGGKPNIPLSLLLGLFKLLFAIIFYLVRMFTFIVTIQFIQPIPIPNPYFIWFTTAEILGVQPYPLIKNIALFFLSFSIYKSIRRVFG